MLAVHSCRNVRYHVHGIVAVFWLSISMTCKGAFVLQGELVSSATAASSIISIDVFAQAVGDETIAGFTVPFDLPAVPGVTFQGFTNSAGFDNFTPKNPDTSGLADIIVGATQNSGNDFVLTDGQMQLLFSLDFMVASPTDAVIANFDTDHSAFPLSIVDSAANSKELSGGLSIASSPALTSTAVPEPSAFVLLALAAAGCGYVGWTRHRAKH